MIARVIKTFPLMERGYTDRDGRNAVLKIKGVLVSDGQNSIYLELINAQAEAFESLGIRNGALMQLFLKTRCKTLHTENGERYINNTEIIDFMVLRN